MPTQQYAHINPHDYQLFAKDFINSRQSCALWFDMGLGKSLITLLALNELNPHNHALVVAPLNIARSTWIDEIEKWGFPYRYKSLVVDERGKKLSRKKRLKLYEEIPHTKSSLYFINRDLLTDLVNWTMSKKNPIWYFPIVILDEAQSFKSYNSQRFLSMKKVLPATKKVIELTGTPQPKSIEDLWSQIYLLDGGLRLGRTITQFRDAFCVPTKFINGHPTAYIPKPGAEDEIHRRISDIVISMKNTAIKLPDLIFNQLDIELDPDEKTLYRKMLKEFVLEIDGETVTAANAGVLRIKLAQMASGAIYTSPDGSYAFIHDKKLQMALYIVEQTDSPVMIGYHFKSDKEMLKAYFKENGIDAMIFDGSPEMIKDWNAGNIKVLLIQPASAGHGLNLQTGPGHTLIWYTLPSSLEEYLQCNARLYRQGQSQNVTIHILRVKNTVDIRAWNDLMNKQTSQDNLIEAVKAAIDEGKHIEE